MVPQTELARKWKISMRTCGRYLRSAPQNLGLSEKGGSKRKRNRDGGYPAIEEAVITWFKRVRLSKLPVSLNMVLAKASAIAKIKRPNCDKFQASIGWWTMVRARHGVSKSYKLHGEGGSVDLVKIES